MSAQEPEIGQIIDIKGQPTNVHVLGAGAPLVLLHGSGPGVTAFANWRLNMGEFAKTRRVIALDLLGFGYTPSPTGHVFAMASWRRHVLDTLDHLGVDRADFIGNSFGGALALSLAVHAPDRVGKIVLMGSAGLSFPLTDGLDAVWGYTPSVAAMKHLLDIFAWNRALVTDELAELRYRASIRPGVQEAFSSMFPAPRQRGIEMIATPETAIAALEQEVLIVHGRDDKVIPVECSHRLHSLLQRSQLHVFGQCGHWTQIERKDAFNLLVPAFLDGAL